MDQRTFHAPSLVAGLLFVGLGMAFLAEHTDAISLDMGWIWPVLLIGLGLAGLVSGRRDNGEGGA